MAVVSDAIADLNRELQYESLENVADGTPIWGSAEGIDSLSLVQFAVDLENRIEERFQQRVVLTDERALAAAESPFRTVGNLVEFIASSLAQTADE